MLGGSQKHQLLINAHFKHLGLNNSLHKPKTCITAKKGVWGIAKNDIQYTTIELMCVRTRVYVCGDSCTGYTNIYEHSAVAHTRTQRYPMTRTNTGAYIMYV